MMINSVKKEMKKIIVSGLFCALGFVGVQPSLARDTISIVGSSTVYPFSKEVARRYSQITNLNIPEIKSTGSGGGFKLFCKGVGVEFPDITNASRRMKASELETCRNNGVEGVTEVLIGYDGLSIAASVLVEKFKFTDKDLYLGLSKWVPSEDGKMIKNPNTTWKMVNPKLPDVDIKVFGPPASSGTRDAFSELVLGNGAKKFDFLAKLRNFNSSEEAQLRQIMTENDIPQELWDDVVKKKGEKAKGKDLFKLLVYTLREDGVFIETGENDAEVVNALVANPYSIGIIGYGFLQENQKKIRGSLVNGIEPNKINIAKGDYPLSRGLYFYVKKAHVGLVPGIQDFMKVFLSRVEVGPRGYLERKGLIVLDKETYSAVKKTSKEMSNLVL